MRTVWAFPVSRIHGYTLHGAGSSYGAANGGNGGRVKRDYRSMDSLPPPPPSFGPPMPAPSREAELGSAARPGITQNVVSSSGSEELLQQEYFNLPDSAKVRILPKCQHS